LAIPYSRYIVGSLPWYSVLMVSGIFIAFLLGAREEKRLGMPRDSMLDMVLVAVPCGIVGARLYYVLMTLDEFAANPISVLYIWQGGIAVYGSILGGALGVWLYCRKRKRSFAALLDISAPGLALAQAIGRWGNYFNREAFGPVIANPAWQFFPAGVLISENGAPVWHVATFFYESVWDVGVFIALWCMRKHMKRRGDLFLWYLALYGCGRFLVEQLRMDSLYFMGFRVSQYLSLLLCGVTAAVFVIRFARRFRGIQFAGISAVTVLAFLRPLVATSPTGVELVLSLYVVGSALLWLDRQTPLWARLWVLLDAAVYLALLLFGLGWLWQSPYFLYAGLSIPPYLALVYVRLEAADEGATLKEASHAGRQS